MTTNLDIVIGLLVFALPFVLLITIVLMIRAANRMHRGPISSEGHHYHAPQYLGKADGLDD